MYSSRVGSSGAPDGADIPPPPLEKRSRESSSDEDGKRLPNPNKLAKNTHPALARALRDQVPEGVGPADAAILAGPFTLLNQISEDYPAVHRVDNPNANRPLVAKFRDASADNSPASSPGAHPPRDPLRHSLMWARRVGEHPNLNKIHGIASVEHEGVLKPALIVDAGDMTLHDAIDVFEQARVDGKLTDKAYFGEVLPYLARGMVAGAAHCAKAGVDHGDIDAANMVVFTDGRPPQWIDPHLSQEYEHPPTAYWPRAQVEAGNPLTAVYPGDAKKIAGILWQLAAPATEDGADINVPGPLPDEAAALRSLLNRLAGRSGPEAAGAEDFRFLQMGSDEQARQLVAALFKH